MNMKVEIDVATEFESGNYLPTEVSRIHIGEHIGRLYFDRITDKTILVLSESAKDDGSIVWGKPVGQMTGFGAIGKS
jgi:hypothetical protein